MFGTNFLIRIPPDKGTVRKYLLATLPLFDNLVLVAGIAFSVQAIDLLFSVKHSLTMATLHKYPYACTQIT